MATADEYAAWIVQNASKKGTPEFDIVARAYEEAKQEEADAPAGRQLTPSVEVRVVDEQELGQIPVDPNLRAPEAINGLQPETTMAGMLGAVTRGLTPIGTGALLGARHGGLPGAAAGGAAAALAPVVGDPLVRLINRSFGTSLTEPTQLLDNLFTQMGVAVPKNDVERMTKDLSTGIGSGISVPKATANVITEYAARQAPAQAQQLTRLAENIATSGMGRGLTTTERVGGGILGGALGGLSTSQDLGDVGVAGLVGGAAGPVVKGAQTVVGSMYDNLVAPFVSPTKMAARTLFKDIGGTVGRAEEAIGELRQGMTVPTTPGFQPTVPELMAAGGSQRLESMATLAERLAGSSMKNAETVSRAMNERIGALQAQLARINQQIDRQGAMLQPGALDELTGTRDAILKSLDDERTVMENALKARAGGLPTGTQQVGEEIAARAAEMDESFKKLVNKPNYQQAFKLAGDTQIDVAPIVSAVETVMGRPLSSFAPDTAPPIIRALNRMIPRPQANIPAGSIYVPGQPLPQAPTVTATLDVLDDMRKAVNATIAQARRGTDQLAGVELNNLMGLHKAIDDAVKASPLSSQAKTAYEKALKDYRELYVPRFRTSETGKILKDTTFNETRIMPSQVVQQFTKDLDAAKQFVTTFAGDSRAYDSLRNGILGQFEEAAVDSQTKMIDPRKAAEFIKKNREVFAEFDKAGMGIRHSLEQFEQEATQAADVFKQLSDQAGPFQGKTADQVLDYALSDPSRMKFAIDKSGPQGADTLRRVISTRLNQMLTQQPGGEALTEGKVLKVVGELTDSTGNIKPAYKLALGDNLVKDFVDRAKGLASVIKTSNDPALKNPNAIAPLLRQSDFTPDQLTNLQLVVDDLQRMKKVQAAAQAGRKAEAPTGKQFVREQAEGSAARIDKINYLDKFFTLLRAVYTGASERVNPKIAAKLTNVIYNNPDEAIKMLEQEIVRLNKQAQSPLSISRKREIPRAAAAIAGQNIPAAAGAITASSMENSRKYLQEPQP
jgi:hypothetical protein